MKMTIQIVAAAARLLIAPAGMDWRNSKRQTNPSGATFCRTRVSKGTTMFGCRKCNIDACDLCFATSGIGGDGDRTSSFSVICPITREPMKDPVVASDGYTYDRPALMEWFDRSLRSPMTNKTIDRHVVPNYTLLSVIGEQREQQLNPTSSPGQKSPGQSGILYRNAFIVTEVSYQGQRRGFSVRLKKLNSESSFTQFVPHHMWANHEVIVDDVVFYLGYAAGEDPGFVV